MRLTIDGRNVEAAEGMTILQAAKSAGIEIPTLCYLEASVTSEPVACV